MKTIPVKKILVIIISLLILSGLNSNIFGQCTVTVISPSTINASGSGGQYTVAVTTQGGCTNYNVSNYTGFATYTKNGYMVTVTVPSNSGSARSGNMLIGNRPLTVNQACGSPTAPSSASSNHSGYCPGAYSTITLTASGGSGDILRWYSSSCGSGEVGTGSPLTITAPTSTTKYYARWVNGCTSSSCANVEVTVYPVPSLGVSGSSTVCEGTTGVTYSVPTGMSGYSWTIPSGGYIHGPSNTNTINVNWTAAGSRSVNVTYTNSYSCPNTTVYPVTVNPRPSPSITGFASICEGTSGVTYTTEGGMTGYTWTISAGGTINSGSTSNTISVTWNNAGAQTVNVSYTNGYSCPAANPTGKNVTVNSLPTPTIDGLSTVCEATSGVTYTTQTGMTGYTWSVSSGGTLTSGGGSTNNTVTVRWNTAGARTVTVNYTNPNGCTATSSYVKNVTVNPRPSPQINTGLQTVCEATSGVIYTTQTEMTGYTWSIPTGGYVTIGGGTSSVNVNWTAAGSQSILLNYTNSYGCTAVSPLNYSVTVNQRPSPTITGGASVCVGTSGVTYTTESGMTGYTWTISSGGTINSGSTSKTISVTWNATGNQSVSVSYTNGFSCPSAYPTLKDVFIKAQPSIVTQPVNSSVTLNEDASFTVIATGPNLQYQWQVSADGVNSWTDLSGLPAENFQTPTLIIKGSEAFQNDYYRCQINSDCDMTYSDVVKLTTDFPEVGYLEQIPDPSVYRSINTELEVGTTAGSVTTTQLGGLSYSIPLFCSPGTNGVKPNLSLQYNSQSGNGLLGLGWNLAGLSSISRVANPYYNNQVVKAIEMVSADQYAIDGNLLILETNGGSQGADGSKYKTEQETFTESIMHGTSGNGPSWFEVKNLKDNSTLEYGNADNSYVSEINSTTKLTWLLTKQMDTNGNYIKYTYLRDPSSGMPLLNTIEYTGNDNANLNPYNQIVIEYKKRSDPYKYFSAGVEINNDILIAKIMVKCQMSTVRTYAFNYGHGFFDPYSYLFEIEESASTGLKFNKTIFGYGFFSPSSYPDSYLTTIGDNDFNFADINGDGKSDLVVIPVKTTYSSSDKIKVYLNQDGTNFEPFKEIPINPYSINLGHGKTYSWGKFDGGSIIDFDGDGKSDLYTVESVDNTNNPNYQNGDITDQFQNIFSFYHFNGIDLVSDPPIAVSAIWAMIPGDYDGNGKSECFFYTPDKNQIWNGIGLPSSFGSTNFSNKMGPIDFNGDGKTDIYFLDSNSHIHIYGYDFIANQLTELITPIFFDYDKYCFGDVNGDGKTDILGYNTGGTKLLFSTGKNFIDVSFSPNSGQLTKFYIADLNGDGKGDIIHESTWPFMLGTNTTIYAYYYYGNSFTEREIGWSSDGAGGNDLSVTDLDGDGQIDLYLREKSAGEITVSKIIRYMPDDKSRLLTEISNGLNIRSTITYGVLPKSISFSNSTSNFGFPTPKFKLPIYLVENIQSFGPGNTIPFTNTNYYYEDLMIHLQGRGILGFLKLKEEDLINLTKSEDLFRFGTTYYNMYQFDSKQYINNILVSETTSLAPVDISLDNSKRHFSYIPLSTAENKINNTITEVATIIANDGNLTSKTSKAKTSSGTVVSQIYESYPEYNSLGEPLSSSIAYTRGAESITRSKSYEYFENGLLKKEIKLFGASPSVETSLTYDEFGNILTSSVTCGSITRSNTFEYEPVLNRFIYKKYNSINHFLKYGYDPITGNLLEEFDYSNLRTSYQYDAFGVNTGVQYPDGQTIINSKGWSYNALGIGELYFTKSESPHKPTKISYFDFLGKEVRSKILSFDGTYLVNDKVYDSKSRVDKSYMPYFEGNSRDQYIKFSYDDDHIGQLTTETVYPSGTATSYTYNGLETTITKNEQIYKKENDASGLLCKSTDPGGEISYHYNAEGKAKTILSPSGATTIDYDDYGFQKELHDIDAKTIQYDYNGLGELVNQTDAMLNKSTIVYDALGRIDHKTWLGGETTTNIYDPVSELLTSISVSNKTQSFTFDAFNRISTKTETIDNNSFTSNYFYDDYGNINKEVINNEVTVETGFNNYGYPYQVKANNQAVWDATSMNKYGQIDNYTYGNGINTVILNDVNGFIDKKASKLGSTWIQNWDYDFDPIYGNIMKRKGINSSINFLEENFTYDHLNRLLTYGVSGYPLANTYDESGKGNILSKSGIGSYQYHQSSLVHRLDSINSLSGYESGLTDQSIEYTKFNKISSLTNSTSLDTKLLTFTYGPDEQRVKTEYSLNGNIVKTKFFALGNYEKEIGADNSIRELYYISTPTGLTAILEQKNDQWNKYYIHSDFLGSFDVITDPSGAVLERLSFDPWGRRRNPDDWTFTNVSTTHLFDRGFTGHEHLNQFDLINMNGRVYDPLIAMFLSPDNYVQSPDITKNFNRYSYCLNNPLKYADPDGEFIITAIVMLANMYINTSMVNNFEFNPLKWDWKNANTYVTLVQSGISGWHMGQQLENKIKFNKYRRSYNHALRMDEVEFEQTGSTQLSADYDLYGFQKTYFPNYTYKDKLDMFYNNEIVEANSTGSVTAWGFTSNQLIDGKYQIYFGEGSHKSLGHLYLTMGHEFIHVAHFEKFGLDFNKNMSEYAAYMWQAGYQHSQNSDWKPFKTAALKWSNYDLSKNRSFLKIEPYLITKQNNYGLPFFNYYDLFN